MANLNAGENGKKTRFRSGKEAAKSGAKGGKNSGETRRAYANARDCFKKLMTDEKLEESFGILWDLFRQGKIDAFDRIIHFTEDETPTANSITINFASQEMEEYGD